ncbi:MAG: sucrose synthase, partial [Fischerella sp.]|nr:sucrose synthase [Fischerella sp.]
MIDLIQDVLNGDEKKNLRQFASLLRQSEKRYLLRNEILNIFHDYCKQQENYKHLYHNSYLSKLVYFTQEIILDSESLCLVIRPQIATQQAYRLLDDLTVESVSIQELLDLRDRLVNRYHPQEGDVLKIDFQPFYDYSPIIRDPKNIGKGVAFLNRYLSSKLFYDRRQWQDALFNFLHLHHYKGYQLLISDRIQTQQQLSNCVKQALTLLAKYPADTPYENFRWELQNLGFEPGWGNTAARVHQSLEMLDQLIDSPDNQVLEAFLSQIPMIFRILLVSPHGWFGQEGVLGRPDTGGQVVYLSLIHI